MVRCAAAIVCLVAVLASAGPADPSILVAIRSATTASIFGYSRRNISTPITTLVRALSKVLRHRSVQAKT